MLAVMFVEVDIDRKGSSSDVQAGPEEDSPGEGSPDPGAGNRREGAESRSSPYRNQHR